MQQQQGDKDRCWPGWLARSAVKKQQQIEQACMLAWGPIGVSFRFSRGRPRPGGHHLLFLTGTKIFHVAQMVASRLRTDILGAASVCHCSFFSVIRVLFCGSYANTMKDEIKLPYNPFFCEEEEEEQQQEE
jgi:hypothetical protein